jgi:phosphatidylinositol-3-phosphatase
MGRGGILSIATGVLCAVAALFPAGASAVPDIKHVWVVVLENKDYKDTFGPDTEAPYLARDLTAAGQLLPNYFGTSHASLGNYLTMVSGQAPNMETQGDCPVFTDIFPGVIGPEDQAIGQGCVYPKEVKTIANQLEGAGFTWRGYMEDMGNTPEAPKTCRHPKIGEADDTEAARPHDQYATRHDPFVYFHAIIDSPTCDRNVVPLERLTEDVKRPETTPNFAFITPDLCNDGHDEECADGGPGGLPAADLFLKRWVPEILRSPGFAEHGLLIVTWDEANIDPDSSRACCEQPIGLNTPMPGVVGPGGGQTGTVLLSPFVKPGSVNETPYNHYGLLRSLEDIFGLPHLGYAARPGLKAFGADVFNAAKATAPAAPPTACRSARRGRAVAALRLRSRVLTFRARRTTRIRVTARFAEGKSRRLRRPRRIVACRLYHRKVPKGTRLILVREGKKKPQRVRRGPSGEHGETPKRS